MENQNELNQEKNSVKPEKQETWFDVIKFVVILLAIIIPIRMFVIEPYMVRGDSMYPNFLNNDYLLTEKWSTWGEMNYDRGDIVIFKSPASDGKTLIKRIIGLPGETIKIEKGITFIAKNLDENGEPNYEKITENFINQEENNLTNIDQIREYSLNFGPITLESDEFFVMGDNRLASYDSRFWGPLPKENVIGRPILRIFHFNKIGFWPETFSNYKNLNDKQTE